MKNYCCCCSFKGNGCFITFIQANFCPRVESRSRLPPEKKKKIELLPAFSHFKVITSTFIKSEALFFFFLTFQWLKRLKQLCCCVIASHFSWQPIASVSSLSAALFAAESRKVVSLAFNSFYSRFYFTTWVSFWTRYDSFYCGTNRYTTSWATLATLISSGMFCRFLTRPFHWGTPWPCLFSAAF